MYIYLRLHKAYEYTDLCIHQKGQRWKQKRTFETGLLRILNTNLRKVNSLESSISGYLFQGCSEATNIYNSIIFLDISSPAAARG